jgi:SAM-dependent methyltransferase
MSEERWEQQGAAAPVDWSLAPRAPGDMPDQDELTAETSLASRANTPDRGELLDAYPQLPPDDLRTRFADAQAGVPGAPTVTFRRGATRTIITRTHGLPAPDPSIHKGNIFKGLIALLQPGRMLDLGAGKGNFSVAAAQLGWKVTAVDARTVRWPDPDTEPDPALANVIRTIHWVQADVREFPIKPEQYDLICILGLLHHLEVTDQVSLLKRCSAVPTLLDTRIAKAVVDEVGPYDGMLVREIGQTREERDAKPQNGWGNPVSFRHTEESLLRLIMDCGYIKMLQMRPPHRADYTFYLCLPAPAELRPPKRRARRATRKARRGKKAGRGERQASGNP